MSTLDLPPPPPGPGATGANSGSDAAALAGAETQAHEQTVAYELHGNCYLNLTAKCTLRCAFCPKFNGSFEVQGYDLTPYHEPSVDEMITALGDASRYQEIVFCGLGEPTLRLEALLETGARLKRLGCQVRLNTDGLANLVHGRDVTPALAAVVDKVSISLNAQDEQTYIRHTRPTLEGSFAAAQDFAACCKVAGIEVTLTAIEGLAGVDIAACEVIARGLGVAFRRRVLDEVG